MYISAIIALALISGLFASVPSSATEIAGAMVPAAQATGLWRDPSPHRTRLVTVEKNVTLEVLDWGGSGRAVVMLAASGCTAHEFDDFAPKLTDRYHVYGVTRRGFGRSGFVAGESGADLLGNDVVAVLDALKLSRPILVGHSFAGEELSTIANRHPDRIAGAVYLEAAYPLAFDNGEGMSMAQFQQIVGEPQPPPPTAEDLATFRALQDYLSRTQGVRWPEAELREDWEMTSDGVLKRRTFPGSAILMKGTRKYTDIPVPALVIFANPHSLGPWANNNTDASVRAAVEAYSSTFEAFTKKQEAALREAVHTARVISIPDANHFVFITNEAEVLRQIRGFIAGLH
jgi:non-heme chloroperoxidase